MDSSALYMDNAIKISHNKITSKTIKNSDIIQTCYDQKLQQLKSQ